MPQDVKLDSSCVTDLKNVIKLGEVESQAAAAGAAPMPASIAAYQFYRVETIARSVRNGQADGTPSAVARVRPTRRLWLLLANVDSRGGTRSWHKVPGVNAERTGGNGTRDIGRA